MNVAGLNWFVDSCWEQIREEVRDVRLVVCGRIKESWNPKVPGIEVVGELSREEMFERLAQATIAINPCVAGTGLKIKTVEAASLGLPSVCLPNGVDGLEDVASAFALVANTPKSFTSACIRLLKDEMAWKALQRGALRLSKTRFSNKTVYRELDEAMGWKRSQEKSVTSGRAVTMPRPVPMKIVDEWLKKHGSLTAARAAAEAIVAKQPDELTPYITAGELALRDKDGWRAAAHGAVVAALTPADPDGYRMMAQGFMIAGLWREAKEALQQALMVRAGDPHLLELLEKACSEAGDSAGSQRAHQMRQELIRTKSSKVSR